MVNRADLKTIVFGKESDTLLTDIGGKSIVLVKKS